MIKSIASIVGILTIALVAGFAGGAGNNWGNGLLCRTSDYFSKSSFCISSQTNECLPIETTRLVAALSATLVDEKHDGLWNQYMFEQPQTCTSVEVLVLDICKSMAGGHSGNKDNCTVTGLIKHATSIME